MAAMWNKKYCGLVVWFNPEDNAFINANSYIDSISKLYIIDNSSYNNQEKISSYEHAEKCSYIWLKENKGLAYALDYGCKVAIQDGFDYILTMDQDSKFEPGAAEMLFEYAETMDEEQYAIVCPNVISIYYDDNTGEEKEAYINWPRGINREMAWTMTSGSLMSLHDYRLIDGFDHGLFIQHIDVDLGVQFSLIHRKVIALGDSILRQRFGNSKPKKLLWKTVHPSYDNPVRTYYRFRNQIYMEKKYGRKTVRNVCDAALWRCAVKDIVFEKGKLKRIGLMIKGCYDGWTNRLGKYEGTI